MCVPSLWSCRQDVGNPGGDRDDVTRPLGWSWLVYEVPLVYVDGVVSLVGVG